MLGYIWIAIVIVTMPTYRKLVIEQLNLCDQVFVHNINAENGEIAAKNVNEPAIVVEMKKEQEEAQKKKIDVSNDPMLKDLNKKVQALEEIEKKDVIENDGRLVNLEDTAERQDFSSISISSKV